MITAEQIDINCSITLLGGGDYQLGLELLKEISVAVSYLQKGKVFKVRNNSFSSEAINEIAEILYKEFIN